ncbi:unnamed protein product [Rotaria magnacalcarata]|uniref:Uncharacterized protein n=1 Tax=Rotaria magnacalcarata TaxID=392030 RepID=A0A819RR31_9BILA|nr:unnamed protein product [Rotaria magnacalcarata]
MIVENSACPRSVLSGLMPKFQDAEQCQKNFERQSQKDRLVIIVSDPSGHEITPYIHRLRQVISIYVYCMNKETDKQWADKFVKVRGVFVEFDAFVSQIAADHKIQKTVEEPLAINTFTADIDADKSTAGANDQFIFTQVLIDCLLRLKSTQKDIKELMDYCNTQYEGNNVELSNIREFQKHYSLDKALSWYTRESFFCKALNAALCIQDIHAIFLFRAFISDIHRHSTGYEQARSFFKVYNDADNTEAVLFEIDVNAHSEDLGESEMLSMLGSIFRLNSVNRSTDGQLWIIRITLCTGNEHDLKQVFASMKQRLGSGEKKLEILGKVLWEMGQLDLAEKYFIRFLGQLPLNDPSVYDSYENLGTLTSQIHDYHKSIQWQKKLSHSKTNSLTTQI